MFEASQVESSKRTVGADGNEDISRRRQPCDVIHFSVMGDELGHCCRRVDVPNGTCRID